MILKAFTIYDNKAEAYLNPFFMGTTGEALRAFTDAVNDRNNPNSNLTRHPADYQLFEIGEFENGTGNLLNKEPRVNLGNGLEYSHNQEVPT